MLTVKHAVFPDVLRIWEEPHYDNRGLFRELFRENSFNGKLPHFVQDNYSVSKENVFRGLHFQRGQGKLVFCLWGTIEDYFLDIRPSSASFGKVGSFELYCNNAIWIPNGYAHGFHVKTQHAVVFYKLTDYYNPDFESGVNICDSDLIGLPNPLRVILSDKDKMLPRLREVSWKPS